MSRLPPERQAAIAARTEETMRSVELAKLPPGFETIEDFLARLPIEEQEKIRAGARVIAEEIRQARLKNKKLK